MKNYQITLLMFWFLSISLYGQTFKELAVFEPRGSSGGPSIAYHNNYAYVLFTDATSFMGRIMRYNLTTEEEEWSSDLFPTIADPNGENDASHNDSAIAVDGDGYIHCWIGMHNDALKYYKSISPGSYTNFTENIGREMTRNQMNWKKKRYTYPSATTSSNGDVFVILRDNRGKQKDEDQWLFHWDNKNNTWSSAEVKSSPQGRYNAYVSTLNSDANNTIHIVTAWSKLHDGPNTFQKGTYMRYNVDNGKYYKADGVEVTLPMDINTSNADMFYAGEKEWHNTIAEIQVPTVTINNQGYPVVSYTHNTDPNYSPTAPIYEASIANWTGSTWKTTNNILGETIPNWTRPPISNTGNRINVIVRSESSPVPNIISSTDCGNTFTNVVSGPSSGSGANAVKHYNNTTDLYIDRRRLFKIEYDLTGTNNGCSEIQAPIVGGTPVVNAPTTELTPVADSYLRNGVYGNSNYGSDRLMTVKKGGSNFNREALLKFDLSEVSGIITSAKLRMEVASAGSSVSSNTWDVKYVTNDSWTETNVTSNNAPISGSILNSQTGKTSGGVEWDISSQVIREFSGDKILSLNVSSTSLDGNSSAEFYSKEASGLSTRPVLVLVIIPITKLVPVADTFLNNGRYGDINYGLNGLMTVKKGHSWKKREALLKFDLSGVSGVITSAKLRMEVASSGKTAASTTWDVKYVTDDNWTETNVTSNNAPISGSILNSQMGQASGGVEWDISSQVIREFSGDKILSLNVSSMSLDGKSGAEFYSKEASAVGTRPVLVLVVTPVKELVPVADSYVRNGVYSDDNYGASGLIAIKKGGSSFNREAFFKFDLSEVTGIITSAKLRMEVASAGISVPSTTWDVRYVTDDSWTETNVTFNNSSISGTLLNSQTGQASGVVEWDITRQVITEFLEDKTYFRNPAKEDNAQSVG